MGEHFRFSLVALVLIGVMSGCGSSPKDASKENFMVVLSRYHQNNDCIIASIIGSDDLLQSTTVKLRKPDDAKQYDALVDVGILKSRDGLIEERSFFGLGKDINQIPVKTYTLTEAGEKIYHFKRGLMGTSADFCISKYQVKDVVGFSEPTPMFGYTVSNVIYSVLPQKKIDLASNQRFLGAFPKIREQLIGEQRKKATLILLDSGWVHEKELDLQKPDNKPSANNPLNPDPESAPRFR